MLRYSGLVRFWGDWNKLKIPSEIAPTLKISTSIGQMTNLMNPKTRMTMTLMMILNSMIWMKVIY